MYFYRPRFGIFRRLIWFGLGVGAANWYLRTKERRLDSSCYRYPRPVEGPSNPAYAWPSAMTPAGTPPAEAPTAHEHMADTENGRHGHPRWGWRRPTETQSAPATPAHGHGMTDAETQAEVERLQRAAEALWEQRKAEAVEATVAARETARDFAVQNLHRLTELLQRIGSSLEEERRRTDEEKKRWV